MNEYFEYEQASDVFERWDADDKAHFANWVVGLAPETVLIFELYRRRLPMPSETKPEAGQ